MIQISGNFAIGSSRAKISRLFKFEIWKAEGSENAMKATGRKKKTNHLKRDNVKLISW